MLVRVVVVVHKPDTEKWLLVPFLMNKVHFHFGKVAMHPSSWKMYYSMDNVVACGFMACVLLCTFKIFY